MNSPTSVYLLPPEQAMLVRPLFAGQTFDQPFRDAVFEGRLSVPIVVDHPANPTAAVLCHPFYYFVAGPVIPALRLFLQDAPEETGVFAHYYAYATDQTDWCDVLAADRDFMTLDRLDFKWPAGRPAPGWRDRLPFGATLERMDGALAERVDRELNEHITANWASYANFDRYGDGLALILNERIASAAYTAGMSSRHGNISIVTAPDQRGRGLATLTCSALVDRLLERGIQPTWCCDAINTASAELARKLGFVNDRPYWQVGPHWGQTLALSQGRWAASPPTTDGVAAWRRVTRS